MTNSDDDFFSALEAEIAPALAKSALLTAKDRASKTAANRLLPHELRTKARKEVEGLAAQLSLIQWRSLANVALFAVQHCDNCASDHRLFLQHMARQVTTSGHRVERLARVPGPDTSLPREVLLQLTTTHVCSDCCGEFGYDLSSAMIRFVGQTEPFAISATYLQEELDHD